MINDSWNLRLVCKISQHHVKKEIILTEEEQQKAKENVEAFIKDFTDKLNEDVSYKIEKEKSGLKVELNSQNLGYLIGYRGEALNAMQVILTNIASKEIEEKVKVILDIANYKDARKKTLEDLAVKLEKTVIKKGKQVTLEPMTSYERKIIHTKLQDSEKVRTYSIGEGDKRRVVIAKK